MILRDATAADAGALDSFDLGGQPSVWLDEVAEIVAGLVRWQHDEDHIELDRRVVVAEGDGTIVAVTAHERLEHDRLGPLAEHRYVMVVAVRADHRRSGIGTALLESVLAEMQHDGVLTASWLVHPANLGLLRSAAPASPTPTRPTRQRTGRTSGSRCGSDAMHLTLNTPLVLFCSVESGYRPPRVPPEILWCDNVIHGLDICRPMGLHYPGDKQNLARAAESLTMMTVYKGYGETPQPGDCSTH